MIPLNLHESRDTALSRTFKQERTDVTPHGSAKVAPFAEFGRSHNEPSDAHGAEVAKEPPQDYGTGMPEEKVHRNGLRRFRPSGGRDGFVRFKPHAHVTVIKSVDNGCPGRAVHNTCPEPVSDPELQNRADVPRPNVAGREINLVLFQEQDVQRYDWACAEIGRVSSPL